MKNGPAFQSAGLYNFKALISAYSYEKLARGSFTATIAFEK
jgi:hypothetical protein